MKRKLFDRITNVIVVLLMLALTGFLAAVAWGLLPSAMLINFVNWLRMGWIPAVVMAIVLLVMLVVCIRILFVRQKRPQAAAAPQTPGIVVRNGENGAVFLTIAAMEEMVLRFVRGDARVRECRCEVAAGADSVGLRIRASFTADANIPETTKELQEGLKAHIEGISGVAVREIQFVVEQQTAQTPAVR